ncbi:MAG: threonine dehydratase, partial [Sphingobacteriaceae bacterium]
ESGPALVCIELKDREDYTSLILRMQENRFDYKELNNDDNLFEYFI